MAETKTTAAAKATAAPKPVRRTRAERIEIHAATLEPRRAIGWVATLPFYVVGWVVGLILRGLWWLTSWAWSALVIGFREGREARKTKDSEQT